MERVSFACGYLIVSATLVEKAILSPTEWSWGYLCQNQYLFTVLWGSVVRFMTDFTFI